MTNNQLNRERLEKIKSWRETYGAGSNVMLPAEEAEELAHMALAAMNGEPFAYIIQDKYERERGVEGHLSRSHVSKYVSQEDINEHEITCTPLYRHAQLAPEYPEVLPCSVLLEPGLRFGKGIKTSTMLSALARRAVHESDMAALSPEERAEFQARIEDFKALIAQPAPVVPDGRAITQHFDTIALETAREIMCDVNRRGDFLGGDIQLLSRIQCRIDDACRAAMLQVGNSPAQSDCCLAQNSVAPAKSPIDHGYRPECECSGCKATARICADLSANSPANPGCWCRTCRPVAINDMRFVVCPDCGNKRCPRANDHRNACTGSNEPGQEGSAYPADPQEVK